MLVFLTTCLNYSVSMTKHETYSLDGYVTRNYLLLFGHRHQPTLWPLISSIRKQQCFCGDGQNLILVNLWNQLRSTGCIYDLQNMEEIQCWNCQKLESRFQLLLKFGVRGATWKSNSDISSKIISFSNWRSKMGRSEHNSRLCEKSVFTNGSGCCVCEFCCSSIWRSWTAIKSCYCKSMDVTSKVIYWHILLWKPCRFVLFHNLVLDYFIDFIVCLQLYSVSDLHNSSCRFLNYSFSILSIAVFLKWLLYPNVVTFLVARIVERNSSNSATVQY